MPRKKTVVKNEAKISAVGRRREAVAMVTIVVGKGDVVVNKTPAEKYFPGKQAEVVLKRPFEVTETLGKYSVFVRAWGGGKVGQLGAVVLGMSRALVKTDESLRSRLRRAGLLTRDPRQRERRKVGTGGKARRQKQSPKR